ncbi:hypothetical protein ACSSS7_000492 [Eimeria intestinalis]
MQTLPVGDRRLGAAAVLSVFLHFSAACLAHAASAPDVAAGQGAPSNFFPRGCSGLRLEGPLGVCSSFSDAGGKSSSSWLAFSPPLLDGCSAFVLLVMLLLLMDSAGLLLPTFWSRVFSLLASIRASSSNDGTAGLSAARTPELHALEQQEQQLQRELRQYTPSSDFVAYSRLRRQLAKVTAAKESCMRRQQQQNNSSSDNGEGGLWASLLWPIMKPVLLANSWMLMKPLLCWLLFKGVFGATIDLPTSQLAPLTVFGSHLALTFPFSYLVARICVDAVYGHLDRWIPSRISWGKDSKSKAS